MEVAEASSPRRTKNMPEYENGDPCWLELRSSALEASVAFYRGIFGWKFSAADRTGASAELEKRLVAGLRSVVGDASPGWVSFFSTVDAEATTEAILAAGGRIIEPLMADGATGRRGLFADNTGARFALLQPGERAGAEIVGEPGTYSWSELISDDVSASVAFYNAVFGWTATEPEGPLGRIEFHSAGRPVAGLLPKGPHMPADLKPYWDVYFQAIDADAAAAAVPGLGGQIALAPINIDRGRLGVFVDPGGAIFSVVGPTSEEPAGKSA
jgi:predicted enzyme related to lactoylglutathione lyase